MYKGASMITSLKNPQIRNIIQLNQKAKERRVQKLFTAEGRKMFLEAPADWVEKVYVSETIEKDEELMARVQRFPMETVSDTVFRQMCDTQTPQGILTVLRSPSYDMEDLLRKKNRFLWSWRICRIPATRERSSGQERERESAGSSSPEPVWILQIPR